jgi:hypothetical protein
MLCDACQEIFRGNLDLQKQDFRRPHHRTSESILGAVRQGCYICTKFWVNLHLTPERLPEIDGATRRLTDWVIWGDFQERIYLAVFFHRVPLIKLRFVISSIGGTLSSLSSCFSCPGRIQK